MRLFKVPIEKSSEFYLDFFTLMSDSMQDLLIEYQKWPDEIIFSGHLGLELNQIIIDRQWNFSSFKIVERPGGITNSITIKYQKPLTVSSERSATGGPSYLRAEGIHGKEINGIPDSNTLSKLMSHTISSGFKIEKTERPQIEIRLER